MKLGIVVTLHDDWEESGRRCLLSLVASRYALGDHHIYVFDNESSEHLYDRYDVPAFMTAKNVTWIRINDQERYPGGLTATWNKGALLAIMDCCDAIIFANHDTVFNDSVSVLSSSLIPGLVIAPVTDSPGTGEAFGQGIENKDKTPYLVEAQGINGFCFAVMATDLAQITPLDMGSMMIDDFFFFDPRIPFGGNEEEWCKRAKDAGIRFFVNRRWFVKHNKKGPSKDQQQTWRGVEARMKGKSGLTR